jgi:RNA polymerase sigma-70 factor (ECF subfamily)
MQAPFDISSVTMQRWPAGDNPSSCHESAAAASLPEERIRDYSPAPFYQKGNAGAIIGGVTPCYDRIVASGTETDVELANALLAGSPGAFENFVTTYRAKIFQYSLLMCGHREDAEEVAQETLLKVFEKLDQLREPERMRGWVFRIARNACLMKRRKSSYAPARELSLDELMPTFRQEGEERRLEIADWSELADETVIRAQLQELVRQSIEELPDIYRSVILLRDFEELSTQETAEVLDITEDTVKTRLHRARLAVRRHLDRRLQAGDGAPS